MRHSRVVLAAAALLSCGNEGTPAPAPPLSVTAASFPLAAPVRVPIQFQTVISRGKPPYRVSWAFGDGSTSTAQNPTHAYTAAGSFTVRVDVEDSAGEHADAQLAVRILEDVPATAAAQVSATSGEAPLSVQFTGAGSGDAPITYSWEFGDGTSSRLQNPTHTYRDPGTYTATLTVADSGGEQAIQSLTVTVSPPPPEPGPPPPDRQPIAAPVVLAPAGTAPFRAEFVANATGGDGTLTFAWDFGDGETSTEENPAHVFQNPGRYRVQFQATDEDGDTVRSTLFVQALADKQPLVSITAAFPVLGCGSVTTSFRAQASGGDEPYTYAWDFGDGQSAAGDQVVHRFDTVGTFQVKVTATDADGDRAQAQTNVFVRAQDDLQIGATLNPASGPAPLAVQLSLGATCGRDPLKIDWVFGDGITASGTTFVRHVYDAPGTYGASVTVTDSSPTPVTRTLNFQIQALENVPRIAVQSFGATATENRVCYNAVLSNSGSAATNGCYALRGSPGPAPCGVLAAIFSDRGAAPTPSLAPAAMAASLPPLAQGGSAGPVDLRACIGLWRSGADAVRFLPGTLSPSERWPVSLCIDRPPGTDRPWVAAVLNDPDLLIRRADLSFATGQTAAPLPLQALRVNEVASGFVELRGVAAASLTGLSLEVQPQGIAATSCSLSGALDGAGFRVLSSSDCAALPAPASGTAVRLKMGSTVLDQVGYGTTPPTSEGTPAPAIPAGGSIARLPDGVDTNANATDFVALAEPTPGAPSPRRGDQVVGPIPLALGACAAFTLAGAVNDYMGYGPSAQCTPGDCSGPDQVLAADLAAGSYRLDVVAFETGAIAGWHLTRAVAGACAPRGDLVASGAGDATNVSLASLPAGRYCLFVDGALGFAGSLDYVALVTRAGP
jgi:PKD repeat protein